MTESDADTAPVQITVSPLTPISGRGDIKLLASVTLDIGGVKLTLHGWTLRMNKAGRMRAHLPAYCDPRTGEWAACVELPDDLLRAVGEALLSQVPGAERGVARGTRFTPGVTRPVPGLTSASRAVRISIGGELCGKLGDGVIRRRSALACW